MTEPTNPHSEHRPEDAAHDAAPPSHVDADTTAPDPAADTTASAPDIMEPAPDIATLRAAAPVPPPRGRSAVWPALAVLAFLVLFGAVAYLYLNPVPPPPGAAPDEVASLREQVQSLTARLASVTQTEAQLQQLVANQQSAPQAPAQPTDQGSSDALAALTQRVTTLENRPAPPPPTPAPDLRPLEQRVAALEHAPAVDAVGHADFAKLASRVDAVAGRQDQLDGRLQAQEAALSSKMDTLQGQVGMLDQRVGAVAKAADGAAGTLGAVQQKTTRLAQLAAARAALDEGQPLGPMQDAPTALARFATAAPPTLAHLRLTFPAAAQAAADASRPADDAKTGFWDRVEGKAESLVTVRRGDRVLVGDPSAGVLARARAALDAGDLAGAVAAVNTLTGPAAAPLAGWKSEAQSLLDARAALAALEAHA
jgi:hypothetical protein